MMVMSLFYKDGQKDMLKNESKLNDISCFPSLSSYFTKPNKKNGSIITNDLSMHSSVKCLLFLKETVCFFHFFPPTMMFK